MPDGIQSHKINPMLVYICECILNASMILEILLAPTLIYLVLRYSRQIRSYKYFLLNNIFWCFSYALVVFTTKIHFNFPAACISYNPIVESRNFWNNLSLFLFIFTTVNMILSMIWALVHRCAFASNGWLREFFEHSYRVYIHIILFHVVLTIFLIFIFYYVVITDPILLKDEFVLRVPHLAYLADTGYYICLKYSSWIRMNGVAVTVLNIFITMGTMYMYVSLYFAMKRNEKFLRNQTLKMQFVLFNAVSFQILNYYIMALLPMTLSALSFSLAWDYSEEVATITEASMALHGIIDYMCIVYFITPYRRAVVGWFLPRRYVRGSNSSSIPIVSDFKSGITRFYPDSMIVTPFGGTAFEMPAAKPRYSLPFSFRFKTSKRLSMV